MNLNFSEYEIDKPSLFPENPQINSRIIKKRRTNVESESKEYKCGCFKKYYSYQALYTHVRNKHNKIFPIGSYSNREIIIDSSITKNKNKHNECQIGIRDFINRKIIFNYKKFLIENKILKEDHNENTMESNLIFITLTEEANKYSFIDEFKADFKDFYDKFIIVLDDGIKINQDLVNKSKLDFNLYQRLFHFMFYNYFFINKAFLKEMVILILMKIQNCIEYVDELVENKIEKIPFDKSQFFNFSIASNDFINIKFYEKYNLHYKDKLIYFGIEDDQIHNLIYFVKFINNWFFTEDYTNNKVEIHYELLVNKV